MPRKVNRTRGTTLRATTREAEGAFPAAGEKGWSLKNYCPSDRETCVDGPRVITAGGRGYCCYYYFAKDYSPGKRDIALQHFFCVVFDVNSGVHNFLRVNISEICQEMEQKVYGDAIILSKQRDDGNEMLRRSDVLLENWRESAIFLSYRSSKMENA